MNSISFHILPCMLALPTFLLSCSNHDEPMPAHEGCRIKADASILAHNEDSRAIIYGTDFPVNGTVGLFLCRHEDGEPSEFVAQSVFNNVCMTRISDGWNFIFEGTSDPVEDLYITENKENTNVDIYAYSPWWSGTKRPDKIYFDRQHWMNYDYMYAIENSGNTNKDIKPENGKDHTITLHFKHIFCLIRIGMKARYATTVASNRNTLSDVKFEIINKDAVTKIQTAGYFNALTGEVYDCNSLTTLSVSTGLRFSNSNFSYTDIKFTPTEVEDDALCMHFYLNGTEHPQSYVIKASDVLHSDGVTRGFKSGYIYTFNFIFDNYVRLDNVQIDDDWETDEKNYIF